MIEMILAVFGGVCLLLGVFALFKILTNARKFLFEMVDGDFLAFLSMIAFVILIIGGSAYWIFSSIDFEAARSFKRYIHSFAETYLLEGGLCLLLTYGFSKINPEKLNGRAKMNDGKRSLVIILGIFFGLLAIFLGLNKIIGD